MQIRFCNKGTTLIASIIGELDQHSADYLRDKLDAEILKSTTKNVVFDFSKVSFMDSSGIGIIMGRYKNIQKLNGKVAIANVNTQIRRVFEISGMFRVIPVYESMDSAIKAM